MVRTSFTFWFKISPPTLFSLNLHQLVTAGTSYHAKCLSLWLFHSCKWWYTAKIHVGCEVCFIILTWTGLHDFAVSLVTWDFSVQLHPTGLSAAKFCHRFWQTRLLRKDRGRSKNVRIWSTWGLGRGLHVPNVLRTPNCLIWLSWMRLGKNNGTSVKLVHHVMAPCATNKTTATES